MLVFLLLCYETLVSTSAVSKINLKVDTHSCELRDTPAARFFTDVLLFEDV